MRKNFSDRDSGADKSTDTGRSEVPERSESEESSNNEESEDEWTEEDDDDDCGNRHSNTTSIQSNGKHTKSKGAKNTAICSGKKYGKGSGPIFNEYQAMCEVGLRKVRSVHLLLQVVHIPYHDIGSLLV